MARGWLPGERSATMWPMPYTVPDLPYGEGRSIARAWGALAVQMQKHNATTVAELERGIVENAAKALWIILPGRSMV